MIGELILAYGTNQKFQQISVNTLFITAFFALAYAFCAIAGFQGKALNVLGIILGVILAVV